MAGITLPVVTVPAGSRTIDIDTGELLFPGLVLAFCLYYFLDTRGLPDLSMLYAGPLLYTTAALAVVTLVQQAITIDDRSGPRESGDDRETAGATADPAAGAVPDDPNFTVRNAALLVALTAAYILVLEPLGFLTATVGFLALTLYLFGERNPVTLIVYSIGFAFVLWFVFVHWLRVPL